MGKIYYLIGKSASGKDTLLSLLLNDPTLGLSRILQTTTRPMRDGETDGVEYHFISNEDADRMEAAGKVIERRIYHTVYGEWSYMLADDGTVDPEVRDYITAGTVESYVKTRNYFGRDRVVPIYIYVEPGERLYRALQREREHENPKYTEMCRRFIADEGDFDEAHLKEAELLNKDGKIRNCFENEELPETARRIADFIRNERK